MADADVRAAFRHLRTLPVDERLRLLLEYDGTQVGDFWAWWLNRQPDLPLGNLTITAEFTGQKGQLRCLGMKGRSSNGASWSSTFHADGGSVKRVDEWQVDSYASRQIFQDSPADDTGRDTV